MQREEFSVISVPPAFLFSWLLLLYVLMSLSHSRYYLYPPLRCFVGGVLISIVISMGYNMHALLPCVDLQTIIHIVMRQNPGKENENTTAAESNKERRKTIVDAFTESTAAAA